MPRRRCPIAMKARGWLAAGALLVAIAVAGMLVTVRALDRSEVWRAVGVVEVSASRRLTPLAMWPALSMLVGFVLIMAAPRRAAPVAGDRAETGGDPGPRTVRGGESRPLADRPWSWAIALLSYLG